MSYLQKKFKVLSDDKMFFNQALEFSKTFPGCHPKIFEGTIFYVISNNKKNYVIVFDQEFAVGPYAKQLENYLKTRKLKMEKFRDYLMVRTLT